MMADPSEQVMRRVLKGGSSDDPRIGERARLAASQDLRRPWRLWMYAANTAVMLLGAFLAGGQSRVEHGLLVFCWTSLAVLSAVNTCQLAVARRRARRYLPTCESEART